MNDRFKPGEIGILQNAGYFHEYNETPALVLSDLYASFARDLRTLKLNRLSACYRVRILCAPELNIVVRPDQIRRLRGYCEQPVVGRITQIPD